MNNLEPDSASPCAHYFDVSSEITKGYSRGTCRNCGTTRQFKNYMTAERSKGDPATRNKNQKAERKAKALWMSAQGSKPAEIAEHLGVTTQCIRGYLKEAQEEVWQQ